MFNFLHHQMPQINLLVTGSLYFSMIYKTKAKNSNSKKNRVEKYVAKIWNEAKVFHNQSYCLGLKWDIVGKIFVVF